MEQSTEQPVVRKTARKTTGGKAPLPHFPVIRVKHGSTSRRRQLSRIESIKPSATHHGFVVQPVWRYGGTDAKYHPLSNFRNAAKEVQAYLEQHPSPDLNLPLWVRSEQEKSNDEEEEDKANMVHRSVAAGDKHKGPYDKAGHNKADDEEEKITKDT